MSEPKFRTIYERLAEELNRNPDEIRPYYLFTFLDELPPDCSLRKEIVYLLTSGY
jgi:hypothetical protein